MKKALITGITGQDGSYLAELLIKEGYQVHGIKRRSSSFNTGRIDPIYEDPHGADDKPRMVLHYADMTDGGSITNLLHEIKPSEVYNLAAQSHVKVSFEIPEYTADAVAIGTLRLLEGIRKVGLDCRFYQASSSEMFGNSQAPQSETTKFDPRSPYAVAKVFGHYITTLYRYSYGMFAANGILFNHESPRRGETFVTRKITQGLSRIALGQLDTLYLGNLDARRDWGYAPDYVRGMWQMLQYSQPDDFVLATGETHTVREFVEEVGRNLGMEIVWRMSGKDEIGVNNKNGDTIIKIDPRYFRPAEVDLLLGDATKARTILRWEPRVTFKELARIMTESDFETLKRQPTMSLARA